MDDYVDLLQKQGGSLVMIAKGKRSLQVTQVCRENGGSIGGPAALLAQESIRRVEDFPAFVLVDNKGNDSLP